MKQYQKAQMIAKNLPTGSYAAGCPSNTGRTTSIFKSEKKIACRACEVTM